MTPEVPTYDLVFADLAQVVLEESYVLSIDERAGAVEFSLDAVLAPGHSAYRPALPGEQYCFKRGTLVVTGGQRPRLRLSGARPAFDATGDEDLDHVDALIPVEGGNTWLMTGTWGELEIVEPTIRLLWSEV